jgi:O-antigen ligase
MIPRGSIPPDDYVWSSLRTAFNAVETRLVALWLFAAAAAVVAGWFVSGEMDALFGKTMSLILIAGLIALALSAAFAQLGASALLMWPPLAVIAYALVRVPRGVPVITFDRVWICGLVAYLILEPQRGLRAPATRFLTLTLLWLAASFGLRAWFTSAGFSDPVMTWVDAIVLPLILFLVASRYSVTRARTQRLAASMMIAGGVLGAIGIAEKIGGFELATYAGGAVRFDEAVGETRVSGPYPVPEPYALSLIVCFAATMYWLLARKRGPYFLGGLCAVLELGGITLTLFRAAWLGAILVLLASFGLRPREHARTLVVGLFVAGVALAIAMPLEQNTTFSKRTKDTTNIYGRLATYEQGLKIFRSEPVFGVGVNRYHGEALDQPPVTVKSVPAIDFPHSSFVGLLAEQGIVGFLPLLLASFAVWRLVRAFRRVPVDKEAGVLMGTLVGAGLGYLVMSLTLTMLPYEPPNAFFAVLLGAAAGRLNALRTIGSEDSPDQVQPV